MISLDVYARTNPAFCSLVLHSFVRGYVACDQDGVAYPLMFLPLPIVLSDSRSNSFTGTNKTTGFWEWVSRNPQLTVGFTEAIERTAQYTREALLFGVKYRFLEVTEAGRFIVDDQALRKRAKFPASDDRGRALSLAERLGQWMGPIGSTESVFFALGATS